MIPFKRGFVEKCAEYGIDKEAAKDLYKQAILPFLISAPYNYTQHDSGGRAALAGLGALGGTGVGAAAGLGIGGGLGTILGGALGGEKGMGLGAGIGGAAGLAAGAPLGWYTGYHAGDWLGTPNQPPKKKEDLKKTAQVPYDILGLMLAGGGAGAYNYSQNQDIARALLSGVGTTAGAGAGSILGGVGLGVPTALMAGERPDVRDMWGSAPATSTAMAGGMLGGGGLGGYAGYKLGDLLGGLKAPVPEEGKPSKAK
jgi:MFS family permease